MNESVSHCLYCPICTQNFDWVGNSSVEAQPAECDRCGYVYKVVSGRVRAKRSRRSGRYSNPEVALRLLGPQREEKLVEWCSHYDALELRAGDRVVLLLDDDAPVWINNLSVDKSYDETWRGWIPKRAPGRREEN